MLFSEVLFIAKEMDAFPLDYIRCSRSVFLRFMSFTFVPFSASRWYILSHDDINYQSFYLVEFPRAESYLNGQLKVQKLFWMMTNNRQKLLSCNLYLALRFVGTLGNGGWQFPIQQLRFTIKHFFLEISSNDKLFKIKYSIY